MDFSNEMWGTDGLRIETVEEGGVWVFSAVDHFDACGVGIHVVKIGKRFAASPRDSNRNSRPPALRSGAA